MSGVGSMLRVSIIGVTGSGKSTFAGLVEQLARERGLGHCRIKLAQPLYDLQAEVYRTAGVVLKPGAQDQVLMEDLAGALRRIRPTSLADRFLERLAATDAPVVINDDLRDPDIDAVVLRDNGFRIVRVRASEPVRAARLQLRADLSRSDRSTARLDAIKPDAELQNDGDLETYTQAVRQLIGGWL